MEMTKAKKIVGFKHIYLLLALMITFYMTTAIVQNRLVALTDHYYVAAAVFVYPLSYLISDIVAEVYGYQFSRQMLWLGLMSWFISAFFVMIFIREPYPAFWAAYSIKYDDVMSPMFRCMVSGVVAVITGQFINMYCIAKLKILTRGSYFWIRSVSSCLIGDVITVFLSIIFIFVGRMSFEHILEIASLEIVISIILQSLFAIPAMFIVAFLKHAENINYFDYNTNFNPFKFEINYSKMDIEN